MTQTHLPIPVRPAHSPRPGIAIERAAFAKLVARRSGKRPALEAMSLWPKDRLTMAVLGEKSTQTIGATDGWASDLMAESVADFFASLGPLSAMSQLIGRGVTVSLESGARIGIPYRSAAPSVAPWVAEGDPIPVLSYGFASNVLGPARKCATMTAVSGELVRRAGAEAIFRRMLREDAGKTLDAAYFSSDAASDAGVAGLLHGVTATPGRGSGYAREDMAELAGIVSQSGEVAFVVSPKRAARMRILEPESAGLVFASPAVADSRLIALDPLALVHGFGGEPDISTSIEGLLHMSDDPDPIRASGTTADPVRSLFQTDAVATRMIIDLAFVKLTSNAVAYMDTTIW